MPEAIGEFDAGTGGRKTGTDVRDLDCEECLATCSSVVTIRLTQVVLASLESVRYNLVSQSASRF